MTQPTFLYIGAPKSGSSWLFEACLEHPQVFVPIAKDLQFFDSYYDKGLEWYLSHFEDANSQHIAIGELSHDYYLYEYAAHRIFDALPNVKLLLTLREPGSWAISSYKYARMHAGDVNVDLLTYMTDPQTDKLKRIQYLSNLIPFYQTFPEANILVTFYEDFQADPQAYLRSIYRFIGVDPDFTPNVLNNKVNSAKAPRFIQATKFVYGAAQMARKFGLANLVGTLKRSVVMQRLLYQSQANTNYTLKIPPQQVAHIRSEVSHTYTDLEALISRQLPSIWYKALS